MRKQEVENVEVVKMANGYMVREYRRPGDFCDMSNCYVFNEFADAADKIKELLGDPAN